MNTSDLQNIKQRYNVVGNSDGLNRALDVALQVAATDLSVLIIGESGVGKEIIPRIIHDNSTRRREKYFAINCGSIPEGTIDSELFGHEKGSFTGAIGESEGYFGIANKGTIFLDEVGELPIATQARLLRVLETGEYYVYTIPYSHLFNTYMKQKAGSNRIYRESTLMESFEPVNDKNNKVRNGLDVFIESCYSEFMSDGKNAGVTKDEFSKDMSNILGNISICNDGVPLPILEEGWSAMEYFKESVTMEAGEDNGVPKNIFAEINKTNVTDELSKAAEGIHGSSYTSRKNDFKDITDCYFKLIDSTKLIPLEVMGTVFGYYYVLDDTISPLSSIAT